MFENCVICIKCNVNTDLSEPPLFLRLLFIFSPLPVPVWSNLCVGTGILKNFLITLSKKNTEVYVNPTEFAKGANKVNVYKMAL